MSAVQEGGKVATSVVDAFKSQPGLLFLTLVNMSFLVFVYFVGTMVNAAYEHQQAQIHERYLAAIHTIDRCLASAFDMRAGKLYPEDPRQHGYEEDPRKFDTPKPPEHYDQR